MSKRWWRHTMLTACVLGLASATTGCGARCNAGCQAAIRNAAIGGGVLTGANLAYCEENPTKFDCRAALGEQ